jgi:asparagine synthase (glutamine-hydrolysing)
MLAEATAEPIVGPNNAAMLLALGAQARDRNCGVLLTGLGGNVTVSYDGHASLSRLFRSARLIELAREVMALRRSGQRVLGTLFLALGPSLPPSIAVALRGLGRRHAELRIDALSAIESSFAQAHRVMELRGQRGHAIHRLPSGDSWAHRIARVTAENDNPARRMALEFSLGVEMRDPTHDIRVVNYCLNIPDDQFLRRGQTRWLIRRAMRGLLPQTTLDQRRRGLHTSDWPRFVVPYRAEMLAYLDDLNAISLAQRALDLPSLRRLLVAMPETLTAAHEEPYMLKLMRGLAVGAFIQCWASGGQRRSDSV